MRPLNQHHLPDDAKRRRIILLLRLAAAVAFAAHLLLAVRPHDEAFFSRPFQEDAFYSLSVARSLAEGTGLSVDGVHPTNGVQPLICFLDVPLFAAAGDLVGALRLVMLLQALIYIGTTFAVASFAATLVRDQARRVEVFWLVAALVAWSYMLANGMMNGLETGLAAGLVFGACAWYNRGIAPAIGNVPVLRLIGFGALLGVAVLARIDIAFLVLGLVATHLLLAHLRYHAEPAPVRTRMLMRTILECAVIGMASLVVSAPWWIYNVRTFGSVVPISGQAQQMLIPDRMANVKAAVMTITDSFAVMVNTPRVLGRHFPLLGGCAAVLAVAALLGATRGFGVARGVLRSWRERWVPAAALPVLLHGIALVVYYVFFFGAPHFIVRYLVPLRILIALAVITFLYFTWKAVAPRSPLRIGMGMLVGVLVAGSVFGLSWNFTEHDTNIYMFPARWIAANVPATQHVGMFQSGTTGFLCRNVVNLDGKVNAGALHAMQAHRVPEYVDSMKFDYLIDWAPYVEPVLDTPLLRGRYRAIDTLPGDFVVWKKAD